VPRLNRDPTKLLGTAKDIDDVKAHVFFKDVSWEKMMKKEIEVAYKPKVKAQDDTSNFDETFTKEQASDSFVPPSSLAEGGGTEDAAFKGFTFQQHDSKLNGGT